MKKRQEEVVVNLKSTSENILKTILLTGNKYGSRYIIQLLKGNKKLKFRKAHHLHIETFGTETAGEQFLNKVFYYLLKNNYIEHNNGIYATYKVAQKGAEFLENPQEMKKVLSKLYFTHKDWQLFCTLRDWRNEIALKKKYAPSRILSDFAIKEIVEKKPKTYISVNELKLMKNWQKKAHSKTILNLIKSYEKMLIDSFLQKVKSPTYQETKQLFEKGYTIEEIATHKHVTDSTILSYLTDLHVAKELNLNPWIENNIKTSTFQRAVDYFKNAKNKKLKVAFESLKIDYNTLKLCKLYVSDFQTKEEYVFI